MVGIAPAVYLHFYERRKERLERTFLAYNEMGDKWSEFLWGCLDHQQLGLVPLGIGDAEQEPEELYLYSLLIQLLNRAYVNYRDEPEDVRADRYRGWEAYMQSLSCQPGFRKAWKLLGKGYDTDLARDFDERLPQDWRTLDGDG